MEENHQKKSIAVRQRNEALPGLIHDGFMGNLHLWTSPKAKIQCFNHVRIRVHKVEMHFRKLVCVVQVDKAYSLWREDVLRRFFSVGLALSCEAFRRRGNALHRCLRGMGWHKARLTSIRLRRCSGAKRSGPTLADFIPFECGSFPKSAFERPWVGREPEIRSFRRY